MYKKIFMLMSAIGDNPELYVSWSESILSNSEKKLSFSILEKKTRFHECEYTMCIKNIDDFIALEDVYNNLKKIYLRYFGEEYED